jgi:hypothetical protein
MSGNYSLNLRSCLLSFINEAKRVNILFSALTRDVPSQLIISKITHPHPVFLTVRTTSRTFLDSDVVCKMLLIKKNHWP